MVRGNTLLDAGKGTNVLLRALSLRCPHLEYLRLEGSETKSLIDFEQGHYHPSVPHHARMNTAALVPNITIVHKLQCC